MLRWPRRGLREEGSAGKAALSREKGSSGSQNQACSTLCLAGKEVIYKLTQLLESHNTEEGARTIPVRGTADGAGGGHREPRKGQQHLKRPEGTKEPFVPGCLSSLLQEPINNPRLRSLVLHRKAGNESHLEVCSALSMPHRGNRLSSAFDARAQEERRKPSFQAPFHKPLVHISKERFGLDRLSVESVLRGIKK